jgi:hypothetical protein
MLLVDLGWKIEAFSLNFWPVSMFARSTKALLEGPFDDLRESYEVLRIGLVLSGLFSSASFTIALTVSLIEATKVFSLSVRERAGVFNL